MAKKVLDNPDNYSMEDMEGLSVSDVYTEHASLLENYYYLEQEVDNLRSFLSQVLEAHENGDMTDMGEVVSRIKDHLEGYVDYEEYDE